MAEQPTTTFAALPLELKHAVASWLKRKDRAQLALVCRELRAVAYLTADEVTVNGEAVEVVVKMLRAGRCPNLNTMYFKDMNESALEEVLLHVPATVTDLVLMNESYISCPLPASVRSLEVNTSCYVDDGVGAHMLTELSITEDWEDIDPSILNWVKELPRVDIHIGLGSEDLVRDWMVSLVTQRPVKSITLFSATVCDLERLLAAFPGLECVYHKGTGHLHLSAAFVAPDTFKIIQCNKLSDGVFKYLKGIDKLSWVCPGGHRTVVLGIGSSRGSTYLSAYDQKQMITMLDDLRTVLKRCMMGSREAFGIELNCFEYEDSTLELLGWGWIDEILLNVIRRVASIVGSITITVCPHVSIFVSHSFVSQLRRVARDTGCSFCIKGKRLAMQVAEVKV